jgi:hypothetical protein
MTKTVYLELDQDMLNQIISRAGTSEPRKAVMRAVEEYVQPASSEISINYFSPPGGFFSPEEAARFNAMGSNQAPA